jgi:hypothetical protein
MATKRQVEHYFALALEVQDEACAALGREVDRLNVQAQMAAIKSEALHETLTGMGVAVRDFKPSLIVDSVSFDDVWGDGR